MRVTERMFKNDSLSHLQDAQQALADVQNKMSTNKEVNVPSDDPMRYVTAQRFRAIVASKEQYIRNINDSQRVIEENETAINRVRDLLQRTRVLMVQGSNSTLVTADTKLIALEMRQSLESLLQFANDSGVDGRYFGGTRNDANPFEIVRDTDGSVTGTKDTVTDVIYRGNSTARSRIIADGSSIDLNLIGSKLFQIDPDTASSSAAISDPTIPLAGAGLPAGDQTGFFTVQGKRVYFDSSTDSLNDIAARINAKAPEAAAQVIGPVAGAYSLQLAPVVADQLFLDDQGSGRFLARLGLTDGTHNAPANIPSAQETDLSVFKVIMDTIANLENGSPGEIRKISENRLPEIDRALENFGNATSDIGAQIARLTNTGEREKDFIVQAKTVISQSEELDLSNAIVDLRTAELQLQTAIGAASNVPMRNLLSFL